MSVRTHVRQGSDARQALVEHEEEISARLPAFCQRSPWLLATIDHLPGRPLLITHVDDGPAGLAGLAALTCRRRADRTVVTVLGGDQSDYAPLWARDDAAADAVMTALAGWLRHHRRWELRLPQVLDEVLLRAARSAFPEGVVVPGQPIPIIEDLPAFTFSRSRRRMQTRTLHKLHSLYGDEWALHTVTGEPGRWTQRVVDLRRARDHGLGRRSHLDRGRHRDFYVTTLRETLRHGRGRLHLMTVQDALAGYALIMTDGPTHRLCDGRVDARFLETRAGAVTSHAALQASQDAGAQVFDWLRGVTQEKSHTRLVQPSTVIAHSHPWLAAVDEYSDRARHEAKRLVARVARR